jgi:hypothetical protein
MFGQFAIEGEYLNTYNESIPLMTSRGITYGDEYYGNFLRSLYTLFQVLTGESWSEAVARPAIFSKSIFIRSSIFYVSFVLICGITLINVAVAVLLEKMVDDGSDDKNDELEAMLEELDEGDLPDSPGQQSRASGASVASEMMRGRLETMEAELMRVISDAAQREERLNAKLDSLLEKLGSLETSVATPANHFSTTFKRRRQKQRTPGGVSAVTDASPLHEPERLHRSRSRHTQSSSHAPAPAPASAQHEHHSFQRRHVEIEDIEQDGELDLSRGGAGRAFSADKHGFEA